MAMKYYRNASNEYLGGWDEELTPPEGAIEVPVPPAHVGEIWNGSVWSDTITQIRVDAKRRIDDLQAIRTYQSFVFTTNNDPPESIQMPLNGVQDFINMLGMQAIALTMLLNIIPTQAMPFRGRNDLIVMLLPPDVLRMVIETVAFVSSQYEWTWTEYAYIDESETAAAIAAVVSTAESEEPAFVDTQSPVKAFKGYPR